MRIGIGGIRHETNSFSNVATTVAQFQNLYYDFGSDLITKNAGGVRTPLGGFIDEAAVHNIELAPSFYANATPSGHITPETLDTLTNNLVNTLWEQHEIAPLDAIALSLHGAGVADNCNDIESHILLALRERFGWDLPIGVTLDLHANVTDEMVKYSTILMGVKCYPHVDEYENARILLNLLHEHVANALPVHQNIVHLPWLLAPGGGVTISGPAHDVQQLTIKMEEADGDLLQATFFHGFPYADIPQAGVSVVTVAKTEQAAHEAANTIAQYAWEHREEFTPVSHSPAQAFDMALALEGGPIVINESSDNPGGGAPGDGTHLLREMIARNLPGTAFGSFWDPAVVQQAIAAGIGSKISCSLGAKADNLHGEPILLDDAYVKTITDGQYICKSPMGAGKLVNIGPTVLLQTGNVKIVVSTHRLQTFDCNPFEAVGINYQEMHILGLKSSQHFRAWWQDRAKIVPCDPPGIHCSDLSVFRFENANTTYYPLQDAEWNP